jgi:hypothetical protein
MPSPTGPHLAVAVLCENVLQEKDETLSAIRIIERIIRTAHGPEAPAEMAPFAQMLHFLIMFRSDQARGSFTVGLRPEDPSGHREDTFETSIHLEGAERGANIVLNLGYEFPVPGLYWFDVLLSRGGDDEGGPELVSRIPLRVMYQRAPRARPSA